jgi:uncharacterized protein DUF4365
VSAALRERQPSSESAADSPCASKRLPDSRAATERAAVPGADVRASGMETKLAYSRVHRDSRRASEQVWLWQRICPAVGRMQPVSTDQTERVGVEAVRAIFARLGWFVREPVRPDYGIDLFVETSEDRGPTGRLLAVQVKSGATTSAQAIATSSSVPTRSTSITGAGTRYQSSSFSTTR